MCVCVYLVPAYNTILTHTQLESSEVKVKRAKKKKKPTTEAQDLFDSPSIFDDPLGLGN